MFSKHIVQFLGLPNDRVLEVTAFGKTKSNYVATHGIAEYQRQELIIIIQEAEFVTVCLDTSTFKQLNERTGSMAKDLDIIIKLFNNTTQTVEIHFLDVHFLSYETADIQLTELLKSLHVFKVDLKKVVQLGRDNPNVNKTLFSLLKNEQKEKCDGEIYLLDIGSCNLHPCHNSFKKAIKKLGADLENILVCHHSFFKLSTVRRDKYYEILEEEEHVIEFFIQHGATRWVTFGKANERLITHHNSMMKFVERIGAEDKSLASGNNGVYNNLKEFYSDKTRKQNYCRLLFVDMLAAKHEAYLTKLQKDSPMACFIFKENKALIQNLLDIISVAKVPSNSDEIFKMKVEKICKDEKRKQPDFYPMLKDALKELPNEERRNLREEFRSSIITDIAYLVKNMNFDKPLIQAISCFDPRERKSRSITSRMLEVAKATHRFSSEQIKDLTNEIDIYKNLDSKQLPDFHGGLRVDKDFYVPVWKILTDFMGRTPDSFILLTKCVMTLSHGQAAVERGFSETKAIVQRGLMTKKTIEGQKRTKSLVRQYDGAKNVPITKSLLYHVNDANSKYKAYMENEKKEAYERQKKKEQDERERIVTEELAAAKKDWNTKYDECLAEIKNLEELQASLSKDQDQKINLLSDHRVTNIKVIQESLKSINSRQIEVAKDLKSLYQAKEKLIKKKPKN